MKNPITNLLKNAMAINRNNLILVGVLVAQLVLTALIFIPRTAASNLPNGPLLKDFNIEDVTGLTIRDKDKNELVLAKGDNGWAVATADNYPVSGSLVLAFLDKLKALNGNRVVAQTSASYNRLLVGDDTFERIMEIKRR